jgi:hypothetical protein
MMSKVGVFLVMLIAFSTFVHAETLQEQSDAAINARVDEANRYLSAEVTRQMTSMKADIIQEIKSNQDENFRIFDGRMTLFMEDTKNSVTIGMLGAAILANGIVGFAMMYFMRKYSYEGYLKELSERQQKELLDIQQVSKEDINRDLRGIQEMQAEARQVQVPTETLGMQYGQQVVGNVSEMNRWQGIPAYQGAWSAPQDNVVRRTNYEDFRQQQPPWVQPPQWGPDPTQIVDETPYDGGDVR